MTYDAAGVIGSMDQDHGGVYLPTSDPDTYESTPLANAGWYDEGQHGGSLAALIAGHLENVPTLVPMEVSRLTVELFRVVPLVPLTIRPHIVREGKRIQVLTADVTDPAGSTVAMGTMQRLRVADRAAPEQVRNQLEFATADESKAPPADHWGIGGQDKVMFHRMAIEMREAYGGFSEFGPGAIWVRLRPPIVAGRPNTPTQRAIVVADFPNGVSRELGDDWVFMNPDLTVHLGRYPVGEWVGLEAGSNYSDMGRGVANGSLWDEQGWIGRTTQSLYLDRRAQ